MADKLQPGDRVRVMDGQHIGRRARVLDVTPDRVLVAVQYRLHVIEAEVRLSDVRLVPTRKVVRRNRVMETLRNEVERSRDD
jgi:hypothetical protein